ncbi:MAG: redoxin domain-containing protein, partial [Candidatus Methylomirabilales bacterium]
VDTPFTIKAFAGQNGLNFPLLSDYNREVCRLYNVLLTDFAGLKNLTAAKRAVFVLDKEGVVRYRWIAEDPRNEPNYDEVSKAVEGIG